MRLSQHGQQAVRVARFAVRLAVAPAWGVLAFYNRLEPARLAILHDHLRSRTRGTQRDVEPIRLKERQHAGVDHQYIAVPERVFERGGMPFENDDAVTQVGEAEELPELRYTLGFVLHQRFELRISHKRDVQRFSG